MVFGKGGERVEEGWTGIWVWGSPCGGDGVGVAGDVFGGEPAAAGGDKLPRMPYFVVVGGVLGGRSLVCVCGYPEPCLV